MVSLLAGRKYIRKRNQGTYSKMCRYCGKSMNVARGRIIDKIEITKEGRENILDRKIMNDQRALWHKQCRKEGRRMEYKSMKAERKEVNK